MQVPQLLEALHVQTVDGPRSSCRAMITQQRGAQSAPSQNVRLSIYCVKGRAKRPNFTYALGRVHIEALCHFGPRCSC